MLSLALLAPTYTLPTLSLDSKPNPASSLLQSDVLFTSRRPAILTYSSRLISLSSRILSLPLYLLGLRSESETILIPMAESTSFTKGWRNIPAYVFLEIQSGQEVQVYDARIKFVARFAGMRWLMYNHRVVSFFLFTGAFWICEVVFAGIGWVLTRMIITSSAGSKKEAGAIKSEDTDASTTAAVVKKEEATDDEPDLSDTPRTFPTYGRQPPLRYVPKVKEEEGSDEVIAGETGVLPADDEEEEEEEGFASVRDSGLGTSFSEGGERIGLVRRRSKKR